jgi:GAF domain-containing protein
MKARPAHPSPPADPVSLTLAERAARALARERAPREVSVDRAFLEAALDRGAALRTLVGALVPGLADWCFVDLVDEGGAPGRVEVAHADPGKAELAKEMRSIGFGPGWATPSLQAIRDRAPRVYREVSHALMTWATHDERHLRVLRAMQPASLAAVPLVARGNVVGAITVIRSTMVPAFDEAALVALEALAAPAALALDTARRFEAERTARRAAEERVEQPPRARRKLAKPAPRKRPKPAPRARKRAP